MAIWSKYQDMCRDLKCKFCNAIFKVTPSRLGKASYCSLLCRNSAYKVTQKDRSVSDEMRQKMSNLRKTLGDWKGNIGNKGENAYNWKGGTSKIHQQLRSSPEYREWRLNILKRDNYSCKYCGSHKHLEVAHILAFASYPELRMADNNVFTACEPCHDRYDGRRTN